MGDDASIHRRRLGLTAGGLLLAGCAPLRRPAIQINAVPAAPADPAQPVATGVDASQRVTAPVRINGAGPFDFVLDTGANRTVVSAELAAMLGLPDAGPANVHGVAGVEAAPTAVVALLEADAITARSLRAPLLARDRLGADGLLGVDVLRDRRVLIDFTAHRLTISGDRSIAADLSSFDLRHAQTDVTHDLGRRIAVPARYRFGQLIIIAADASGRAVTAFVDSGSQSTVGNNALRRAVVGDSPTAPRASALVAPILSATGQTAQGELGRIPHLRIGGMDIIGLTAVFADLHVFELWELMTRPSLLLGMDILSRFNAVELNYAKREVAFYLPGKGRIG